MIKSYIKYRKFALVVISCSLVPTVDLCGAVVEEGEAMGVGVIGVEIHWEVGPDI